MEAFGGMHAVGYRDAMAEIEAINAGLALAPTCEPLVMPPRRAFDRLNAMGIRWVQLSATQRGMRPRELDQSARRDLLATLRRRELSVSGVDAWIPATHYADEQHSDRAAAAIMATIDLAGDLGRCPVSVTWPAEGAEEVIELAATRAEHVGVPIADHAVPVSPHTDYEPIGIGIDPAAWLSNGDDPSNIVSRYANRLVSARLCDLLTTGMRGPVGQSDGRLDPLAYKVALSVAGYERPVVVDARAWVDVWTGLEQTARIWQVGEPA